MKRIALLLLLLLSRSHAWCQPAFTTHVLKDSLFIPWELIYGPDDHIWFTQKNGYICRMDTAGLHTDTLYHEPATITLKESGMLGMALHPSFATQPYVYVVWEYLIPADSSIRERISRYTYSATANTLSSPFILIDSIMGYRYHNGCRLLIVDDKLFISVADATDTTNPQNLNSINGKILRLNLDGSIPPDNPIPGSPVWTWGHRNPQGLVYANGRLYSSEHGPDTDDEINIIEKGHNYGWPYVRGYANYPAEIAFCADSNVTFPLHAWTPTIAPCGIDYYRQSMFPWLRNSLIMASLKDMHLYQLQLSDDFNTITAVNIISGFSYGRLRDVCISPEGKIYISTSNSDPSGLGPRIDKIIAMEDPAYDPAAHSLLMYPNPSSGEVNFLLPHAYGQLNYVLCTADGRTVSRGALNPVRPHITLSALDPGIYYILLQTDNGDKYHGKLTHLR